MTDYDPRSRRARGGFVPIQTKVANSDAQLDFETGLDDTYDAFELRISTIVPATDDAQLQIRVKVAGSYQTSGYNGRVQGASSTATVNESATDCVALSVASGGGTAVGNASSEGFSGTIRFSNPESTTRKVMFEGGGGYIQADGPIAQIRYAGLYDTAGAVTGVRVRFHSGNITSGRVTLYGLVKS